MSKQHTMNPLSDYCPDIVGSEWFFPYNNVLGMTPSAVGKNSVKPVYWKCPKCGAVYHMAPKIKLEFNERNKTSCFSCRGMIQLHSFTV